MQTITPTTDQLQIHHDVVKCKKCKIDYQVKVKLGTRNATQCLKCNHHQNYTFK